MVKKKTNKNMNNCSYKIGCHGCGGGIYGLGIIGAIIYFLSNATGFWNGVLGILKALVWPAILVFELLKFIGV